MKTVAVLGGGPAGSFAAERLARAGLRTILFDEKLGWEKPCGGGITYKAYSLYPYLLHNETAKRLVTHTCLASTSAGDVKMELTQPLVIYSRLDLNRMLLERAARAGAALEEARVLKMERRGAGWRLETRSGSQDADFCVVATGARNPLRDVGTQYRGADTMIALGYYVASNQEHIDIQFFPQFEGYIWVFPRCGHLSVGICGKGRPAQELRKTLERYMAEKEMDHKNAPFYSHMLPSLETQAWARNRVSGDGWIGVGDAAGLVDPITGEGLYYAMRSGDLASQVVLSDATDKASAYRALLDRDFLHDLEFGSRLAKTFFLNRFLFSTVPARMIEFMRRSPGFRSVVQDLFAGTQPYLGLKRRLLGNLHGTVHEIAMSFFLHTILPKARVKA